MEQQLYLNIPNKSFFKVNEVCEMTKIKPYVLRFWESEFDAISPLMSASGQKLYEHKDIEAIILIKKLLVEDKLTIEKAKFRIREIFHDDQYSYFEPGDEVILETKASEPIDAAPTLEEDLVPSEPESEEIQHSLSEDQWQKLVLAKEKLQQILAESAGILSSRQ